MLKYGARGGTLDRHRRSVSKMNTWNNFESKNNPTFPVKGMEIRVFKEKMPEPDRANENRRIIRVYDLKAKQHIALSCWLSQLRPIADALADAPDSAKWVDGAFVEMETDAKKVIFKAKGKLD